MSVAQIEKINEVLIEDKLIGTINGLRFDKENSENIEKIITANRNIIREKLNYHCERLIEAPNDEISLGSDGKIRWRGQIIASLTKGEEKYSPKIIMLADEIINEEILVKATERINLWLRHQINMVLEQILALKSPSDIEGKALKLCNLLYDNFAILPRVKVAKIVKELDQNIRSKLRQLGIKFGAYHIYLHQTLKPAPRELAILLWALENNKIAQETLMELPNIIRSGRTSFAVDENSDEKLYEVAGFKLVGSRAVRIDILERLADIIRPLVALDTEKFAGEAPKGAAPKNGFRVTVEMTSLLGCAGEDFKSILKSLGYRLERRKIEKNSEELEEIKDLAKIDGEEPEYIGQSEKQGENLESDHIEEIEKIDSDLETEQEQFDEIWYFDYSRHYSQNKVKYQKEKSYKNSKKQGKSTKNSKKHNKKHNEKDNKRHKIINKDSPFAALAKLKLK